MATRIISALIALPLLLGVVLMGGNILLASCAILSIVGLFEFYNALSNTGTRPLFMAGYVATAAYYLNLGFLGSEIFFRFIVFMFVTTLLVLPVFVKSVDIFDVMATMGGFFYITFFMSHIYLVTNLDTTRFFIWFVFILAFVTDTFAYFTGVFFGKRKLIPDVSPKKTVEGALGGVLGTVLVCILYSVLFNREFLYFSIVLGLIGSVLSQLGDLIASSIKRRVDIKDYGNIMPGHGGVLDRFDSILITGPIVYYFMIFYMTYFAA